MTPYLMMSLVLPGTADSPGTLVTVVTAAASGSIPQPGEPIVINGYEGTLQQLTGPDGSPAASISIVFDTVAIDAHGNADAAVLREIVAGIAPVSDADWAQLVSEIATG